MRELAAILRALRAWWQTTRGLESRLEAIPARVGPRLNVADDATFDAWLSDPSAHTLEEFAEGGAPGLARSAGSAATNAYRPAGAEAAPHTVTTHELTALFKRRGDDYQRAMGHGYAAPVIPVIDPARERYEVAARRTSWIVRRNDIGIELAERPDEWFDYTAGAWKAIGAGDAMLTTDDAIAERIGWDPGDPEGADAFRSRQRARDFPVDVPGMPFPGSGVFGAQIGHFYVTPPAALTPHRPPPFPFIGALP
jgi:hypothetical protein